MVPSKGLYLGSLFFSALRFALFIMLKKLSKLRLSFDKNDNCLILLRVITIKEFHSIGLGIILEWVWIYFSHASAFYFEKDIIQGCVQSLLAFKIIHRTWMTKQKSTGSGTRNPHANFVCNGSSSVIPWVDLPWSHGSKMLLSLRITWPWNYSA